MFHIIQVCIGNIDISDICVRMSYYVVQYFTGSSLQFKSPTKCRLIKSPSSVVYPSFQREYLEENFRVYKSFALEKHADIFDFRGL